MKKFKVCFGTKDKTFNNEADAYSEFCKHDEAAIYQYIDINKKLVHTNTILVASSIDYASRNMHTPLTQKSI